MMNPFDYSKAVADFWTAQSQALMKAQEQAGAALVQGMTAVTSGKLPMMPDMPRDLSSGASELAQAGKSVMDLWSAAASMSGKLATMRSRRPPAATGSLKQRSARSPIREAGWRGTGEMDDVLGRMAEGPRFADLWEAERRYAGVLQAWMNLRRRGLEHNAVVLEAWLQVGPPVHRKTGRPNGCGRQGARREGCAGAVDGNGQSAIAGDPTVRSRSCSRRRR